MIIVSNHENQLCNRLFALSPVLAYCAEHNQSLMLLFFCSKYSSLFPDFHKYIRSVFETDNAGKNVMSRRLNKLVAILRGKSGDEVYYDSVNSGVYGVPTSMLNGSEKFLTFVNSWKSRFDDRFVAKHKDVIRRCFAPQPDVLEYVDKTINSIRKENDGCKIVGIHIRRGDYKIWREAKYYYDFSFYHDVMQEIVHQNVGEKIFFVITSNETVPPKCTDGFSFYYNSESSGICDLYLLSKCDYIAGPPSTYSQWASFYGDVPLKLLCGEKNEFSLADDFSEIETYRKFRNGKQLIDLDGVNFVVK